MLISFEYLKEKYNLEIKGVLHIGAHHGQENSVYEKLEIQNRIFFEPLKENFRVLSNNVKSPSILYNIALGSETKQVEMFVESANMGQSSSVLEPLIHLTQYPNIPFPHREIVNMERLDNIDFDKEKFNCIVIDVQGYELEVFKGSINTLNHIDYIYSEINREELYKGCGLISEVVDFLKDYGFELVEESWVGGNWGDGFFIKKR